MNRDRELEQTAPNPCYYSQEVIVVADDPLVAVGLLTETNVRMLGSSLRHVFPIPQDNKFDDLVRALDQVCSDAPPRERG